MKCRNVSISSLGYDMNTSNMMALGQWLWQWD